MKKLILILSVLEFTLITSCKAQNNFITTSEATIDGVTIFKTPVNTLLTKFGEPVSKENFFFEMENVMGKIYYYDQLSFYVKNNKVESFIIEGSQYDFTSNNININDNINSLENLYSKSYSNRKNGEVVIQFSNADYFISIHYSSLNSIEKVKLYSY